MQWNLVIAAILQRILNMNREILFTTDIFRISNNTPYFLDNWLYSVYRMFFEQIKLACGKYPILSFAKDKKYFDVIKFYSLCGYEYCEQNWLRISSGEINQEAQKYFVDCFKDYFIITYHANHVMIELFKQYNIDYIDIFEGSVRFLEDIHFVMRSNNNKIYQKLIKYRYPEEFIYIEAGRFASVQKQFGINYFNIKDNSLLLCGQTHSDISLLVDGKYVSLQDCKEKFSEIIKNYEYIYYKPHPYCKNDKINQEFIRQFSDYEICDHNFYGMLSSVQIKGVAALSSGCLKEAEYFGKNIHILSHLYVDYYKDDKKIDNNKFIILSNEYYSPTFWKDVLSPCMDTKEVPYFMFNNNANFLRDNIFSRWSYNVGVNSIEVEQLKIGINKMKEEIIEKKTNKITEKKKIVFVAHEFGLYKGHGGIASYLYSICKYLLSQGHKIYVLCFCWDKKCEYISNKNFNIQRIKDDIDVYEKLKIINPDYVEVSDYLALCLYSLKKKTFNNELQNTIFAVHHHTASRECFEWNSLFPIRLANEFIKTSYMKEKQQFLLSDLQIAPSLFMSEYVRKNYNINDDVHVFHHINLKKIETKDEILQNEANLYDLEPYKDSFNIFLITRFEGRKNQQLLIEQFIKFRNKLNIKTNLFLAGNSNVDELDGEESVYKIYKDIPKEERKYIHLFDFMNYEEQKKIIAIGDLCILPSPYESFSIALAQTILQGIPSMASIYTGCRDYIGKTSDIMCFDPFKKDSLFEHIKQFYLLSKEEKNNIVKKQQETLNFISSPQKSVDERLRLIINFKPKRYAEFNKEYIFVYDNTKDINFDCGLVLLSNHKNDKLIETFLRNANFNINFQGKIIILNNNDEYLETLADYVDRGLPIIIPNPQNIELNKNKTLYISILDFIKINIEKVVCISIENLYKEPNHNYRNYVIRKSNLINLESRI